MKMAELHALKVCPFTLIYAMLYFAATIGNTGSRSLSRHIMCSVMLLMEEK